MTTDQLNGILRALAPLLVGLLVGWGIDSVTAGLIVTAVLAVISAAWSWYSNRPAQMVQSVANQPGVQVVVAPNASPTLKQLAADPGAPTVIPAEELRAFIARTGGV